MNRLVLISIFFFFSCSVNHYNKKNAQSANKIKHDLQDYSKVDNDYFTSKKAVVVVGTTGTGKSSLIRAFCGSNVKVGKTTESETTEASLHSEFPISSRFWIDTQGLNDSKGVPDDKIFADIVNELFEKKINKIKLIWCVSGDLERAKNELKKQARFISDLSKGETAGDEKESKPDPKIWNSCFIIRKQGGLNADPEYKELNGLLSAASEFGSNIKYGDSRLIGFTYLTDKIEFADKNHSTLYNMIKSQKALLKEAGFLKVHEVREEIDKRLKVLPIFNIKFDIKRCSKCGIQGDERAIYALCHPSYKWRHDGHKVDESYEHTSTVIKYVHFPFLDGIWEWAHAHECCGKTKGSKGCKKFEKSWSCCGNDLGSSGCKKVCAGCGRSWGSSGCIKTSEKGFKNK